MISRLFGTKTAATPKDIPTKQSKVSSVPKKVDLKSTSEKLNVIQSTHPIHITVKDGYEKYSYLMESPESVEDIFKSVPEKTAPSSLSRGDIVAAQSNQKGTNEYDEDFDGDDYDGYDSHHKNVGDFAVPIHSSGRTLKAFNKSLERGGRGGLRTITSQLQLAPTAMVFNIKTQGNDYFYGNLSLKVKSPVPILIVCELTEQDIRSMLSEVLVEPPKFKYIYGKELEKLSEAERKKYDTESKEAQKLSNEYWNKKSRQDFWKPFIVQIDKWISDGEVVSYKFVSESNIKEGKNFLGNCLKELSSSAKSTTAVSKSSEIKSALNDMLIAA